MVPLEVCCYLSDRAWYTCDLSIHHFPAPPTSSPPTTTCGALNTIAAANQACSPTTDCKEVDCSYLNYTIAVAVVPCSTPPGVKVTVSDPRGLPLYSQLLTQSQNVTIVGGLMTLRARVDQFNNSLGVKVSLMLVYLLYPLLHPSATLSIGYTLLYSLLHPSATPLIGYTLCYTPCYTPQLPSRSATPYVILPVTPLCYTP